MAETRSLTFMIEGEESDCPECLKTISIDGIEIECVVLEFKCPYCGEPCYAESEDVTILRGKH
jgi:hypothetical protein